MKYPESVVIVEVGPRDGLQNEKKYVNTPDCLSFIHLLMSANIQRIEVTSFVSPKWIPQFKDAKELYLKLKKPENVRLCVLVPNQRGLEDAIEVGAKEIAIFIGASSTFNKKNINKSTEEGLQDYKKVVSCALSHGQICRGYISTSFFCPYEGKIHPHLVAKIAKHLLDLGCSEIAFGDTVGKATPKDVELLLEEVLQFLPAHQIAMHFHNTYGCAPANILKSLEYNIAIFDTSTGGLGGCPYAPNCRGNIATEDVLYMLGGMNIKTNVSLEGIIKAKNFIEGVLGYPTSSYIGKVPSFST